MLTQKGWCDREQLLSGLPPRGASRQPSALGSEALNPGPRALLFVAMGFEFALIVVASVLAGRWLDERFASSPWALIAGAVCGTAAALLRMMSYLRQVGRGEDRP